jgi:radical SAM protein with 4Fe4S-binding SPASM domain
VSLDGASEESNRLTRGANNFEKAVEFVKKIHNPTQKPLIKMVVSQKNLYCAEDFYHFAVSLGCIPEFAFIYKSGNGSDDWDSKALSAQQKLSVLRMVRTLNEKYGIQAYLPKCTVRCPYSVGADQMSVCIKTNGMIQPCQTLYSDDYSIGNIFDFQEEEVVERVNDLVSVAKQRLSQDYGCEKCLLHSACGKGCMAQAVNIFGNPLASDGDCLFRKLQFLDMYVKK